MEGTNRENDGRNAIHDSDDTEYIVESLLKNKVESLKNKRMPFRNKQWESRIFGKDSRHWNPITLKKQYNGTLSNV